MEFANDVITLISNIFACGLILTFLVGLIYGIRFMLQVKKQDQEEYERKKKSDEEQEKRDREEHEKRMKELDRPRYQQ